MTAGENNRGIEGQKGGQKGTFWYIYGVASGADFDNGRHVHLDPAERRLSRRGDDPVPGEALRRFRADSSSRRARLDRRQHGNRHDQRRRAVRQPLRYLRGVTSVGVLAYRGCDSNRRSHPMARPTESPGATAGFIQQCEPWARMAMVAL